MGTHLRIGLLLAAVISAASIIRAEEPVSQKKPVPKPDQASAKNKEVPFPKLPEKAGKISEKAPKKFTETKSGLKYRILREGKGITAIGSDAVEVNYQMWLDDGRVVWSCYDAGSTLTFRLNRTLAGLKEGLQLVKKGGMIELEIPARLAWDNAPPEELDVPAGATIHFVAELVDIKGLDYTP